MGLLEWFLESGNPGPVGKVEINRSEPDGGDDGEPPKKWLVYIAVLIGLFLAATGLYWVFNNSNNESTERMLTKFGYLVLYVIIGHFIRAAPDHSNVGWLGGLVDNPFRISDDYNRWLLFAQIALLPGKFIAYGLVMSWLIGKHLYMKFKK